MNYSPNTVVVGSQRGKQACSLINKGINQCVHFEWHTLLFLKGRPLCASDPKITYKVMVINAMLDHNRQSF